MNRLDFIINSYAKLHNYNRLPYWMLSPFRRLIRIIANKCLPIYLNSNNRNNGILQDDLIVSFTSFPARIDNVWQVVQCMFRQTYRPSKILLWLSKDQFPTLDSVPKNLRDLQNSIFEIRFVEGDLRSHKKYFYSFKELKNKRIVLVDDDLYYPTDMLEQLVKAYRKNPHSVICRYAHIMQYNNQGELLPYETFVDREDIYECSNFFLGTGGGTLVNPSDLYHDVCDSKLFTTLAPLADDIWINAMIRLNNVSIHKIKCGLLLPIKNKNTFTLSSVNNGESKNDQQIKAVSDYYKSLIGIDPFEKR